MFNFSKRLFSYIFAILFLGIFESSHKLFSFDYLMIETCCWQPRCKLCNKDIETKNMLLEGKLKKVYVYFARNDNDNDSLTMCEDCYKKNKDDGDTMIVRSYQPQCQICQGTICARNYYVDKDGKQVKPYVYFARNDLNNLIMCERCYKRNRDYDCMSLVSKFCPNFKSSDLSKLLENQALISAVPGLRLLMRFNGRYEKCTVCNGDVDKFVEKIWYKCSNYSNVHHVHEQCANKLLKNKGNKYICPVCKKDELELVNPYRQSSIEEKKAAIKQFIKSACLKEFLK